MENTKKPEAHLTSAAAFVEGGTQEACDDACSICLEAFSDGDPSTVTGCKHEFHLQCILEWCQRSSQCPMCWQSISLKDPTSQEVLQAVEQERSFRFSSSRTDAIFHHPAFADFDLQHLLVGANDAELEERLIQHLAAAAAMGRARHIARRVGQRSRPSAQGHSQLLVFSARPNSNVSGTASSSPSQRGEGEQIPAIGPLSPTRSLRESSHSPTPPISAKSGSSVLAGGRNAISMNNCTPNQTSSSSQDRAGSSSEIQSFSDSLKSRFTSMSMRYKDSISKSTKGLKERWFSRHASVADLGTEVEREVNAGIATVPRMIECLETRDDTRPNVASVSNRMEDIPAADISHQRRAETGCNSCLADACPSGMGSSSN